jgi:hypothetical protein
MDHPANKCYGKNPLPKAGEIWEYNTTQIEVIEVDPEGRWAEIHCRVSMASFGAPDKFIEWNKQQPLVKGRFHDTWNHTTKKAKVKTDVR